MFCNRATPPADDDGTDATVLWSYNVSAIGGAVTTSPVISWDIGTERLRPCWGRRSLSSSRRRAARALSRSGVEGRRRTGHHGPRWPSEHTDAGADHQLCYRRIQWRGAGQPPIWRWEPIRRAPTRFPRPLSTTLTTYAYVGNESAMLYRIKDVFCPSYNTDAGCIAGLAPSLDTSWGTGGAVIGGRRLRGADRRGGGFRDRQSFRGVLGRKAVRIQRPAGAPLSTHFLRRRRRHTRRRDCRPSDRG